MKTKKIRSRLGINFMLTGFLLALCLTVISPLTVFAATSSSTGSSGCSSTCATWTQTNPPELQYNNETFGNYQFSTNGTLTLQGNKCSATAGASGTDSIVITNPQSSTSAQLTQYKQGSVLGRAGGSDCLPSTSTIQLGSAYGTECSSANCPTSGSYQNNNSDPPSTGACVLGGSLAWIMCPVISLLQDGIKFVSGVLETFLYTPTSYFQNQNGIDFEQTFNTFRNIGLALIVIIGLIMVVSQSIGLEIFEAYTVRRTLPRLVLAIIGMALAWPLMQFIITFFDDIGSWTQQLILLAASVKNTAQGLNGVFSNTVGLVVLGIVGVAAVAISAGIVLSLLLTLLLAFLVALLILTIRQMVILICIITAPLAIATSVLPSTSGIWKLWKNSFLTTMLMFPIIMAFLGAGLALSSIAEAESAAGGGLAWAIMALLALVAPLLMLPLSFKISGGIMGGVSSMVMNGSKGGFGALSNFRQNKARQRWQAAKGGTFWKQGQFGEGRIGRFADKFIQGGNQKIAGGIMRSREPFNKERRESIESNENFDAAMEAAEKNTYMRAISPNADFLTAGIGSNSRAEVENKLRSLGYSGPMNQAVQQIMLAKNSMGSKRFDIAATVAKAGTTNGYEGGGAVEMVTAIKSVADEDPALTSRMLGASLQTAQRAKRVDLYGAGYGSTSAAMEMIKSGKISAIQATHDLDEKAVRSPNGSSIFTGASPTIIKRLAPIVTKDLDDALKSSVFIDPQGNTRIDDTEVLRKLAGIASMSDSANATSTAAGQAVKSDILEQTLPSAGQLQKFSRPNNTVMTIREMMETVKDDPYFLKFVESAKRNSQQS